MLKRPLLSYLCITLALCPLMTCLLANDSIAGPPFVTDDADPNAKGAWEINNAFQGTDIRGSRTGSAIMEINYTPLTDFQLHITPSMAFNDSNSSITQYGYGDTEFGFKYRFITASEKDWWPQVAFSPVMQFPTGDSNKGLGNNYRREFLPVFIQKSFGKWTTYGGGGYWLTHAAGNGNYWSYGAAVQRQVADNMMLGAELYHQNAYTTGGSNNPATTGFNIGGGYDFTEHYHLLLSAGRGLQNIPQTNQFAYFVDLQLTY